MYLEHFDMKEYPFSLTPNTEFYCNLKNHEETLNVLFFSLRSGEGFIKVIGEVGTGKTLLCRKLLNTIDDNFVTAYIPNPDLSPSAFRRTLARELKIEVKPNADQGLILEEITNTLLKIHQEGKRVVLVVDEAQALPNQTLETLRLLTNLETESEKLLQIVLFAQPELDTRLAQHAFRQLNQRITFSHYLNPLSREDTQAYLAHRLSVAGYRRGALFDRKSFSLLLKNCNGTPRVINILCHKAMLVAFGRGDKQVGREAMKIAIKDSVRNIESSATQTKGTFLFVFIMVLLIAVLFYEYYIGLL